MVKRLRQILNRSMTLADHRIRALPILILMPHSRCNCRCVMCDIWKANQHKQELKARDFEPHLSSIEILKVRHLVFSGGEALMHANLWSFCELLKKRNIRITLLSTGLLLEKYAGEVVRWCDEVIVSLDGSEKVHDRIRNIPQAFRKLQNGILALRRLEPAYPVSGRCVLQRLNFEDLPNIITAAKRLQLDRISFLAADVSTPAFNRPETLPEERVAEIALSPGEADQFERIIEQTLVDLKQEFDNGFVEETPEKLRSLAQYYKALTGRASFPEVRCNAPWVSAVIEANGDLLPCFFFPKLGNIFQDDLLSIVNGPNALAFRRNLSVKTNPVCQKCVCSLHLKPTASIP